MLSLSFIINHFCLQTSFTSFLKSTVLILRTLSITETIIENFLFVFKSIKQTYTTKSFIVDLTELSIK